MATTLSAARTLLFGLLCADTATGDPHASLQAVGIVRCHKYEPVVLEKPFALTITTRGMDDSFWLMDVRMYHTFQADPEIAQQNIDTAMPAVDGLLSSSFGGVTWRVNNNPDLDALIAVLELSVGREQVPW